VYNNAPEGQPRYDGHRAIWIAELDPRTLQFAGTPRVLVDGGARNDYGIANTDLLHLPGKGLSGRVALWERQQP